MSEDKTGHNLLDALPVARTWSKAVAPYHQAIALRPDIADGWSSYGNALVSHGQDRVAVVAYQRCIRIQPLRADVHYQLGNALRRQHRANQALSAYRRAVAVDPAYTDALCNIGNTLVQLSRPGEASEAYERSVMITPDLAEAWTNLGNLWKAIGKLKQAAAAYHRAIAASPSLPGAHYNLGRLLEAKEQLQQAVVSYQRVITIGAYLAEAYFNVGSVRKKQGNPDAALNAFLQAIRSKPAYPEAYYNVGNLLKGRGLLPPATSAFERAVVSHPGFSEAYVNLGNALREQARPEAAIVAYERAIAILPYFIQAHFNRGAALRGLDRYGEAVRAYQRAIALEPRWVTAYSNIAVILRDQGKLELSITACRKAIAIRPEHLPANNNLQMTLHYSSHFTAAQILEEAQAFAKRLNTAPPPRRRRTHSSGNDVLRVGYVSGDFRTHPVGYFLGRILPFHNRSHVQVVCYSNNSTDDAMTMRLRSAADEWRVIAGMSDQDAAALIRRDRIDILVDLSGHTAGNRLLLFALKPAPVQLAWIGYFGTTGLPAIDYILADAFVVPEGEESFFTEKVWRLPGCYLCYEPHRLDVPIVAPPALSNGYLTFGSLNNRAKMTPETVAVWAAIMRRLPTAKMLLKTKSFADPTVRDDMLTSFALHGVERERVLLEGHSPLPDALAAYNRMDIALDPFPFGGGATTAETLWMSVPLVTLRGIRWSGRISESMLASLGLQKWVAADTNAYIDLACALGSNLAILAETRSRLRNAFENSALCDGPRFVADLEDAYREIARDR